MLGSLRFPNSVGMVDTFCPCLECLLRPGFFLFISLSVLLFLSLCLSLSFLAGLPMRSRQQTHLMIRFISNITRMSLAVILIGFVSLADDHKLFQSSPLLHLRNGSDHHYTFTFFRSPITSFSLSFFFFEKLHQYYDHYLCPDYGHHLHHHQHYEDP